MLVTLVYLGRGDFGVAGLLNNYEQTSDNFDTPKRAVEQMLEKPFGDYLSQADLALEKAGVSLDSLLGSFTESPLASVDDGLDQELKIGPWYCDACGHPINTAKQAMLQWLTKIVGDRTVGRDLRIVHHALSSPLGPGGCYADETEALRIDGSILADNHLDFYVGPNGLVALLSMSEHGELPCSDVNKVIMRLFVPGYEEARRYFQKAVTTGLVSPNLPRGYFFQHDLKVIVANIHRLED